jgi:alpha-mannosidase
MTERMATNAMLQMGIDYPQTRLRSALEDLLFCEFHDALPGSSVSEVEEAVLQKLDHGLEIVAQVRAGLFLRFLSGQPEAGDGEFPIFVYNSHPHDTEETIVCEFQPQEPNFEKSIFWLPELFDERGNAVPVQLEKESCNIATDQRKRILFRASLRSSSLHRYSCRLRSVPAPCPPQAPPTTSNRLAICNDSCCVEINCQTGLIDRYSAGGEEVLGPDAFMPQVMKDYADPWGMKVTSFRNREGVFQLLTEAASARFAGVDAKLLSPVRVIEQGRVRTVVEALMGYANSRMVLRYCIPAKGNEIEIEVRVFWEEKDRMLKLSIPTRCHRGRCFGQVAYGVEEFEPDGDERVAQRWLAIRSADQERALTVINDRTYGFDFCNGELRLSLLRSPAYAGHPVDDTTPIVRQDRFETRMDQGEHTFTFWLNYGGAEDRLRRVNQESLFKNQAYLALCIFPPGEGTAPLPGIHLSNPAIQLGAWKLSEDAKHIVLRLFESTGQRQTVVVAVPALQIDQEVALGGFELKSLAIDRTAGTLSEIDLLERNRR